MIQMNESNWRKGEAYLGSISNALVDYIGSNYNY